MLFRKLLRTARNYKAQFISMIIMVTIGVGIFLGFNIEWYSIEYDTAQFFKDTNYADFRLIDEGGFTDEDVKMVSHIDGVAAATRFLSVNVDIKNTDAKVALMVSENYTVSTMLITEGEEYDAEKEGIWVSDRFADANHFSVGDELTFSYMGKEVTEKIAGLCKSGEMMICTADTNQIMPDYKTYGYAYISPTTLQKALGQTFYPQINLKSDFTKQEVEQKVAKALKKTIMVIPKEDHMAYKGAKSEADEGRVMAAILPVLFLAIGILTMVTTMHRIAANEKVQIGTLKALGFKNRRILMHYTSYGLFIGTVGAILGVSLGYGLAAAILNPNGMMGTYFDLPEWKLMMPWFSVPVILLTVVFLTFISFLSVKKMLRGTAADTLRPYTPKAMKKHAIEKLPVWEKLPFGTKWNLRDILCHKSRSLMTLFGVVGCMLLLVGGLGMKDSMDGFLALLDDTCLYSTKVNLVETADNEKSLELAETLEGDWAATSGISYNGETVALEIYHADKGLIRFIDKENRRVTLSDEGAYLCLRLADTAKIGDTIEFSPYGSKETYKVKVAGYLRSVLTENIVMTDKCAEAAGIPYRINTIYTGRTAGEIETSELISDKQDQKGLMDTYDTFMEVLNLMVLMLVLGAVILGIVVLYNLGIMSYIERSRELATLKVLGFRNRKIGYLLVS